ncbi:three component ABC system middle component [Pedobacter glucosidilyticus]|uniref:three component ABC system middle component n=1 Tax=Pedobacter glucosidilyticus TaxID=1122941 RepID=UPI0026F2EFC9|nr:three component ABC system middle component [Pedobacter glucosidilyticus]
MIRNWEERSLITANLLNPAFCGEVIRRAIVSYNDNEKDLKFPFILAFLVLPIVLHKRTRQKMPLRSSTYFHAWVEENEYLFLGFADRAKQMLPYTKEAISFLMVHNAMSVDNNGVIEISSYRKATPKGENVTEITEIYKKAELLGKWLRMTGNTQTIFMFLKIRP